MGYNVIVTGGAGFVASHLIDKIIKVGDIDKIIIIDNLIRTSGFRNIQHLLGSPKIEFVHADVSTVDFKSIKGIENVTMMFHLAATRINRCSKFNKEGHAYIADGGFNVIDFCAKNKIKLYFSSTASVYQNPKRFPIEEDDACFPHTIYGSAKFYTENLIRSYDNMYGMDYTINRFFSVFGPRMDNTGAYTEVIYNWLSNIKNGNNKIKVYGNPDEKVLDLVFVEDVVKAIAFTTFQSNKQVFNVSTETGITLSDLIKTIEKVTETTLEIERFDEVRKDVENKRIGSIQRLRNLSPMAAPSVSIEDGIKRTYEWIKTL